MSAGKPALGYKSRTAAVLALRAEGKKTYEIAAAIGISRSSVAGLEASWRKQKGISVPRKELTDLPLDLRAALRPYATKRDMTIDRLIIDLLIAVTRDKIVDAVLDDGVTT